MTKKRNAMNILFSTHHRDLSQIDLDFPGRKLEEKKFSD
jgi:hypothetical protein